ncbi:MAG TPA: cell division protein FtsZ [Candidatus Saccharimonadales bacterium]|nr:cell division protein FtsZ [Candidatus Saccharimonadales bacterium]
MDRETLDTFANIKVCGVGGSGGNAIARMIAARVRGVEFIAINTDAQALMNNAAPVKVQIGKETTRGLGAGADIEVGRKSAEENKDEIYEVLKGADMVFVTYGAGGGTGTGSAPLVAQIARELGALTVGVVTKPFSFEGLRRKKIGELGIEELRDKVDTLITIPNDRLLQVIDKKTSLPDAFGIVDDILRQGVQGISDLIIIPGIINVDFADVRTIMQDAGSALMGIGRASGENRAIEAARQAIDSPLLELSIDGAMGILYNITGGPDMTMYEVEEASKAITEAAHPEANIIFGAIVDDAMSGEIKITVIATGFESEMTKPAPKRRPSEEHTPFGIPTGQVQQPQPTNPTPTIPFFGRASNSPTPNPTAPDFSAFDFDSDNTPATPPRRERPIPPPAPQPTKEEKDDELDVPAFIRRKLR